MLAEAAACMANSAGGGALVVGVDDKTGRIIGANTDPQWLRGRIYDLTDRKLTVQADRVAVGGEALLIVDVPQAVGRCLIGENTSIGWMPDACRPQGPSSWERCSSTLRLTLRTCRRRR